MADNELVNMSSQFQGLPMDALIGGPLNAACDAQVRLANATANFIKVVGFLPPTADQLKTTPDAVGDTRTALFRFKRPMQNPSVKPGDPNAIVEEEVELNVPLLAIVKVPNLSITTVDVNFDMEVKSSFAESSSSDMSASLDATAKVGWGVFSLSVHIQGSVASHKESTRKSDNSAKYTVNVHAEDNGMPEGLARVLDILQTACVPSSITPPAANTPQKKAA